MVLAQDAVDREVKRVAESTRYRLVIADDHPLFRGALREAVSGLFDEVDIAEAGSFEDVAALLEHGGEVEEDDVGRRGCVDHVTATGTTPP